MVNAVPQLQSHNIGSWLYLENATGSWANTYDTVWIVAGPIYNNKTPSKWIGRGKQVSISSGELPGRSKSFWLVENEIKN